MPRGDKMTAELSLIHGLILGEEKAGKTTWALEAAEAGFNVLFLDGDVAAQRINDLSDSAKQRVFYMDVSDNMVGDSDPRMIQTVADIFTSSTFLWNDTKQAEYSRRDSHDESTGACVDEIWEIKPARLDHNWLLVIDSWTTLSYSAMLAKALDLGESLADVEKIERSVYSGTGNRLTSILHTQQKAPCHTLVIGHPTQYEKRMAEAGKTVKQAMRENDQIIEWTKMVPKSSSNPHGYSMGKYFSDIGWFDVSKFGKRVLNFEKTSERTSGGNLNSKGDPRVDHTFADLVKKIGGTIPDGNQGTGPGLTIWEPGTYIPASLAKKAPPLGSVRTSESKNSVAATPAVTAVKGLGGLAGLKAR